MEHLKSHQKIQTAVVYLPPFSLLDKNQAEDPWPSPDIKLLGLPLLKRSLLSLYKAGISRFFVLSKFPYPQTQTDIDKDIRLNGKVTWIVQGSPTLPEKSIPGHEPLLLVGLNVHFLWGLAKELCHWDCGTDTWIVTIPDRGASNSLIPSEILVLPREKFKEPPLLDLETLAHKIKDGRVKTFLAKPEHLCYPIESPSFLQIIEKELLNNLGSPLDGMVDTYLNRPASKILTRFFLKTPITPNQITLLSFIIGILAAIGFAMEGYFNSILGALLFQFSSTVDCSDGEVARLKFMESPFGKWLDITLDNIAHLLIFSAITWTAIRQNPDGGFLQWGLLSLIGISLSFISVILSIRLQDRTSSLHQTDQNGWAIFLMNKFIAMMANRDFSLIVLILALVNSLPWLLILVGAGSNLFGLFLLGLFLTARSQQNVCLKEKEIKKESPQT